MMSSCLAERPSPELWATSDALTRGLGAGVSVSTITCGDQELALAGTPAAS